MGIIVRESTDVEIEPLRLACICTKLRIGEFVLRQGYEEGRG